MSHKSLVVEPSAASLPSMPSPKNPGTCFSGTPSYTTPINAEPCDVEFSLRYAIWHRVADPQLRKVPLELAKVSWREQPVLGKTRVMSVMWTIQRLITKTIQQATRKTNAKTAIKNQDTLGFCMFAFFCCLFFCSFLSLFSSVQFFLISNVFSLLHIFLSVILLTSFLLFYFLFYLVFPACFFVCYFFVHFNDGF